MKLNISHRFPDVATVAEEFAYIRLSRAKRLGSPVPRSVVNLLSEPSISGPRAGETVRSYADRVGITYKSAWRRVRKIRAMQAANG